MLHRNAGALLMLAFLAVACEAEIPNPTGSCRAPNNGARAGYHSPGDGQWLPDCQNPLRREYWRVFVNGPTGVATIPRMDGEPLLQPACVDSQHNLAPLVQRYSLCSFATNSGEVERVNHMAPLDAFDLTRFLHHQLRFAVGPDTTGITPWPIPSDITDACGLHPQTNSSDLAAICEREKDALRSGIGIAFTYKGPGAAELVERLNELYGIM